MKIILNQVPILFEKGWPEAIRARTRDTVHIPKSRFDILKGERFNKV
jgi:hypothetical protein